MLNITEKTEILLEQIGFCDFRTEQGINKARTLIRRALKKNKVEHSVITLENFINKFAPDKELHQGIELTKDNVYDYCDELFGGDSQYVRGLKSGFIMGDESTYSELIKVGNKMPNETRLFVDGIKTDDQCPEADSEFCECNGKLQNSYGFTPYGLGAHRICEECSTVYDFSEDRG